MVYIINKINKVIRSTINRIQYPILELFYGGDCLRVYGLFDKYFFWLKRNNIGDDLNIPFIELLSGKRVVKADYCIRIRKKDCVTYSFIGSILEKVCSKGRQSVVWGSGFKFANNTLSDDVIIRNKYLAVRGPKTREIIIAHGGACPEVYGDPVILISRFVKIDVKKKFKIGLIPHKLELQSPVIKRMLDNNNVCLIDVKHYRDWKDVLRRINECEVILSSSLHGLIISDSYLIPNIWVRFSSFTDGDGFKYLDYYGGIGREAKCIDLSKGYNDSAVKDALSKWVPPVIDDDFIKACPFEIVV